MTYRELIHKSARLLDRRKITVGEYEEMTKPLDRDIECLDKIRAEIELQRKEASNKNSEDDKLQAYYFGLNDGLKDARDILDKYKAESED